jgi:hypothetical protein
VPAKSLIKGMQMLRTILLFMILLACCCGNLASDADETSGAQVAGKEAELDMDNQRLPQGTRLAILLVGLFKPNVTDLVALPSLATHVIDAVGEHNVDVFVNSEPGHGSSIEQATRAFEFWIPRVSLQALVIRPPGVPAPQLLDSAHEDSAWVDQAVLCRRRSQPRGLFVSQYERLRDLYGLVLGHEIRRGERYRNIVRLRTDTVWVRNWPSLSHGGALPIPPASIAGPRFTRNGILLDHFFICSREVSWACFYEAPLLFHRSWDRGQLHVATGCHRVSAREHASIDCQKSIFGINSTWPGGPMSHPCLTPAPSPPHPFSTHA